MADLVKVPDPGWTFRLLPDALHDLGVTPRGVIHVGAHHGEEVSTYLACGFESIVLVEPDPESCAVIAAQPWYDRVTLVPAACAAAEAGDAATFHRSADSVFSGLIANPAHRLLAAFEVPAGPVSAIQAAHPANVLVVDTQGTEMDVLRSADLSSLDLVIVETQEAGPRSYGAYWPELVGWAAACGWVPAVQWTREQGWADTLLVREAGRD